MIRRCTLPTSCGYQEYGGRGITVCPEWRASFDTFLRDMGPRPSPQHSLDRRDANGDYEPGNCRWATSKEQNRNTRKTKRLTYQGETLTVPEWAERTGLPKYLLLNRLRQGLALERVFAQPQARPGVVEGLKPPEEIAWLNMIQRCTNPNHQVYKDYGGKGIRVCPEWRNDYSAFLRDMGSKPSASHIMGRRDLTGDYTRENTAWMTRSEVNRLTTKRFHLEYAGESRSLAEWSERVGVKAEILRNRMRSGWTVGQALGFEQR